MLIVIIYLCKVASHSAWRSWGKGLREREASFFVTVIGPRRYRPDLPIDQGYSLPPCARSYTIGCLPEVKEFLYCPVIIHAIH